MWLLRKRSLLGLKEDKHIRLLGLEHDGLMISGNLRRDVQSYYNHMFDYVRL